MFKASAASTSSLTDKALQILLLEEEAAIQMKALRRLGLGLGLGIEKGRWRGRLTLIESL